MSALSVPGCLLVAVAFCACDPVWIYRFSSKICRASPACQGRLALSADCKALNLKIAGSDPPWSTGAFPPVRLLRQSCGCLPCLSLAQRSTSCSLLLLLFRSCTYVISFHSWLMVMSLFFVAVVVLVHSRS